MFDKSENLDYQGIIFKDFMFVCIILWINTESPKTRNKDLALKQRKLSSLTHVIITSLVKRIRIKVELAPPSNSRQRNI